MATGIQVVIDCAEPRRLASFWAALLGYEVQRPPDGCASWEEWLAAQGVPEAEWESASAIVDPDGAGPRFYFQRVPEGKAVKNRVHVDVNVGKGLQGDAHRERVDAEVQRAVGLGARRVRAYEQHGEHWVWMEDPEGNEFCLQ
jgi:hypothetical protein